MSRPELPHTINDHPHLSISIKLPQLDTSGHVEKDIQRPVFQVGEEIIGTLQLVCSAGFILSLGKIEVEIIGRENVKFQNDITQNIFWQDLLEFQGPDLPMSNACTDSIIISDLPIGYYPARKGTTQFPVKITLPDTLPTSFNTPSALISYTLHARVYIHDFPGMRSILHTSTDIDIIPQIENLDVYIDEGIQRRIGQADCRQDEGGGTAYLEIESVNGWMTEGSNSRVGLTVKNHTRLSTLSPFLNVIQRITVLKSDGKEVFMQHVAFEKVYSADMWLQHQTYQTELRRLEESTPRIPRAQRRWSAPFKAVKDVISSPTSPSNTNSFTVPFLPNAESSRPKYHQSRHSISALPDNSGPNPFMIGKFNHRFSPQQQHHPTVQKYTSFEVSDYRQPAWTIYDVTEESESLATKTPRHLRETSKSRGGSVSPVQEGTRSGSHPPAIPVNYANTPGFQNVLAIQQQTSPNQLQRESPAVHADQHQLQTSTTPPISISNSPTTDEKRVNSTPTTKSIKAVLTNSQSILSPKSVMHTSPESYFDTQATAETINPPSQEDNSMANEIPTKSSEETTIGDKERIEKQSKRPDIVKRRSSRRGSDNKHQALNVFDEESRSSEASADATLYKAGEHRSSETRSSFSSITESDKQETSDNMAESKKRSDALSIPSSTEISSNPKKSARGGRGGRVTSAKQLFEAKTTAIPPSTTDSKPTVLEEQNRKKRHSLPPNMVLTNTRRASPGIASIDTTLAHRNATLPLSSITKVDATVEGKVRKEGVSVGKLRGLIEKYENTSNAPGV
ncbi:uncharacterized protein L201_003020 [Kwoniella dendrophila CBS 6074]|uniref:Arrestin C-terminal-like domain-containing protein n=1 Tax=Kwoniella dendrophila CBS 6074 TaxID=1295534 RepID=A0AAX4JSI4_9TREE